jgi:serine protease AprX
MAIVEALIEVETSNVGALGTFAAAGESFDVGRAQIMNVLPTLRGVHLRPWAKAIPMFTRSGAERVDDLEGLTALSATFESPDLTSVSHVVATEVEEDALSEIAQLPGVRVWPNSPITYSVDCAPFQPPVDVATIRNLIGVDPLHAAGITGSGVVVGVLDQGIDGTVYPVIGGYNRVGGQQPGAAPIVSHGSMVAADIAVAAPDAKLLDFPFLTLLSSGAMAMLVAVLNQRRRDGTPHLVSNSWGFSGYPPQAQMPTHEVWDINHPLNRKVLEVVAAGIPVVFSAGNCGDPCPAGTCNPPNVGPGVSISGANSLTEVISVAAVNAAGDRIGYSSQGPGMFAHDKPDLAGYSHFFGNFGPGRPGGTTAMPFDNGTSAACPVVSGVVALLLQAQPGLAPSAVRSTLIQGAGGGQWNPDTGHGIVNAAASHQALTP